MTWCGEMLVNGRVATGFIVDVLGYPVSEGYPVCPTYYFLYLLHCMR